MFNEENSVKNRREQKKIDTIKDRLAKVAQTTALAALTVSPTVKGAVPAIDSLRSAPSPIVAEGPTPSQQWDTFFSNQQQAVTVQSEQHQEKPSVPFITGPVLQFKNNENVSFYNDYFVDERTSEKLGSINAEKYDTKKNNTEYSVESNYDENGVPNTTYHNSTIVMGGYVDFGMFKKKAIYIGVLEYGNIIRYGWIHGDVVNLDLKKVGKFKISDEENYNPKIYTLGKPIPKSGDIESISDSNRQSGFNSFGEPISVGFVDPQGSILLSSRDLSDNKVESVWDMTQYSPRYIYTYVSDKSGNKLRDYYKSYTTEVEGNNPTPESSDSQENNDTVPMPTPRPGTNYALNHGTQLYDEQGNFLQNQGPKVAVESISEVTINGESFWKIKFPASDRFLYIKPDAGSISGHVLFEVPQPPSNTVSSTSVQSGEGNQINASTFEYDYSLAPQEPIKYNLGLFVAKSQDIVAGDTADNSVVSLDTVLENDPDGVIEGQIILTPGDTFDFVKTFGGFDTEQGYHSGELAQYNENDENAQPIRAPGVGACQFATILYNSSVSDGLSVSPIIPHPEMPGFTKPGKTGVSIYTEDSAQNLKITNTSATSYVINVSYDTNTKKMKVSSRFDSSFNDAQVTRPIIPTSIPTVSPTTAPIERVESASAVTASAELGEEHINILWLPDTVRRWEPFIIKAAKAHGLDPNFIAIIMTMESGGWNSAESNVGAGGLMQVMPTTAGDIAARRGIVSYDMSDPEQNIDFGAWYLAQQLFSFGYSANEDAGWVKSVTRAGMAYNGGPGGAVLYTDATALQAGGACGLTYATDESQRYGCWLKGMWSDINNTTSSTYDAWYTAGGSWLISQAEAEMSSSTQ